MNTNTNTNSTENTNTNSTERLSKKELMKQVRALDEYVSFSASRYFIEYGVMNDDFSVTFASVSHVSRKQGLTKEQLAEKYGLKIKSFSETKVRVFVGLDAAFDKGIILQDDGYESEEEKTE